MGLVLATCADSAVPAGEALPPQVRSVRPADGQQVQAADPGEVCINFLFQAGQGLGEAPQQRISVFFDSGDVTEDVRWATSRDVPTSEGAGCFTAPSPLAGGWHTARVAYSDVAGHQFGYGWRFEVTE